MTVPGPSGLSRFHAIVTATPRDGYGPPVINPQYNQQNDYSTPSDIASTRKRKRDEEDDTAEKPRRGSDGRTIRSSDNYEDCQQLLNGLRERFQQGQDVEFHGNYEIAEPDVSHKQRIQTLTHEIWRTTGYRFTVKDHPRINGGHKTRFWCSQDIAHKNKVKGARAAAGDIPKPRLTSTGDAMAKTRYPCRSRLLISSRDSEAPGKVIVTIRLAHHLAHEPYIDAGLNAEVSKTICESFGWYPHHPDAGVDPTFTQGASSEASYGTSSASAVGNVNPPPLAIAPSMLHEPSHHNSQQHMQMEDSMDQDESPSEDEEEVPYYGAHTLEPATTQSIMNPEPTNIPTPAYMAPPPPPIPPPIPINPDIYQQRMRSHVANIREFCDGLDYQLQFNDTRMLEVLEREGAAFLKLVEDCLQTEGRLVSVPGVEPNVPPISASTANHTRQHPGFPINRSRMVNGFG